MRPVNTSELSGAFVVKDPHWRQKIFFGGLLILLVHPIGWPVALGYRKTLIANLASGTDPLLPDWKGNILYFFAEGIKAMGVIFGYLSPLYLLLFSLMLANNVQPNVSWLYVVAFFVVCTIFSTLSFPAMLVYLTFFSQDYRLPWSFSLALMVGFVSIIFFIPACFLQVSKSGRYLSAFNVPSAWSTLRLNFRAYCMAWYHSALMSLAGHFCLPFAPWGVFWCYLSIIFEFNSILHVGSEEKSHPTWYQRLRTQDSLVLDATSPSFLYRCLNPADSKPCLMLKAGPILVPVPSILAKYLVRS